MAALSALRTKLGLKLTDQNLRILTAAQMNSLLNEAVEVWCDNTGELVQEDAFPVTAKEFFVDAPADVHEIKDAWWAVNAYSPIKVTNHIELDEIGGFELNRSGGTPIAILLEGSNASNNATDLKFRLFPAPTSSSQATTISDAGGISSSDTTIGIASSSGLSSPSGWVKIESEKIFYQNISSTQLLLCRRGMGNTTAASHADSTAITKCDLIVRYTRLPASLSSDADVPEINGRFHKYLIHYALMEALALDGREKEASREERKWKAILMQGKRWVRNIKAGAPYTQQMTDY